MLGSARESLEKPVHSSVLQCSLCANSKEVEVAEFANWFASQGKYARKDDHNLSRNESETGQRHTIVCVCALITAVCIEPIAISTEGY